MTPLLLMAFSPLGWLAALGGGFLQFLLVYTVATLAEDRALPRLLSLPLPLLCLGTALHLYRSLGRPINWGYLLLTSDIPLSIILALYALLGCLAGTLLALGKGKPS